MKARRLHRLVGLILLIPFFGWAFTGLVFFLKPGYREAYELLEPKTYPLDTSAPIRSERDWLEVRQLRTILGDHLMVRTLSGWHQLDPVSHQPLASPSEVQIRAVMKDAFTANPQRYGEIARVDGNKVNTNTGVEVTLDWDRMSFQQQGSDTRRIDLLYRIHYLQWTGVKVVDRFAGFVGIALVLLLTTLGVWLAFRRG